MKKEDITMIPRKQVTFCPDVEVFDVNRIEKENDRRNCWYSKRDLGEINQEKKLTLRLLKTNQPLPPHFCERGLEKHASIRTLQQVRAHQVAVVQAVLNEQGCQRYMGINDDAGISRIASATSEWCQQEAIKQGKRDYEEVYCSRKIIQRKGFGAQQCLHRAISKNAGQRQERSPNSCNGLPVALLKKQTVAAAPA